MRATGATVRVMCLCAGIALVGRCGDVSAAESPMNGYHVQDRDAPPDSSAAERSTYRAGRREVANGRSPSAQSPPDASASAYPRLRKPSGKGWGPVLLILVLVFGIWLILSIGTLVAIQCVDRKYLPKKQKQGGVRVADVGIPHCDYHRTKTGFVVSYRKRSVALQLSWMKLNRPSGPGPFLRLPFFFVRVFHAAWLAPPTRIEVSAETVTVDGTKYRRRDVGAFHETPATDKSGRAVALGGYTQIAFTFGQVQENVPGVWDVSNAQRRAELVQFLAAFNSQLRAVPSGGATAAPTVQSLRDAGRTNEFG